MVIGEEFIPIGSGEPFSPVASSTQEFALFMIVVF